MSKLAAAIGWTAYTLAALSYLSAAASEPRHVMSVSMCTDQLLLELAPSERIASLTYYAREASSVRRWPQSARIPVNFGSVEEILATKPDLVLAGTYTTPSVRALLKKFDIALVEVAPAADFDEIRTVTAQVARALGREAVGDALVARMQTTLDVLAALRPASPPRIVGWGEGGSIPGEGTLFDAIARAAGAVNVAPHAARATYVGFDLEQLLMARPDVIATAGSADQTPSLNSELTQHPLLLKLYAGRRITYDGAAYSCGLPRSADEAAVLRVQLLAATGAN